MVRDALRSPEATTALLLSTLSPLLLRLIGWKSPRLVSLSDEQTIALFFGTFGIVLILTFLFITPYMRRSIWLGWQTMTLAALPFSILTDAQIVRLFPGIDTVKPYFDTRHIRGEEVPADETWQWSENDMIKLARTRGLLPALGAKTEDVIIANTDGADEITPAPVVGLPTDMHGRVLGKDGMPLSAWKSKVAVLKHTLADPNVPISTKVYSAVTFAFFAGVDRDIADYGSEDKEVQDLHSESNAERFYGKTEQVFRFLQVLTSSVASFAHGANDVALSVGPIATMYAIWQKGSGRGSVPSASVVLDWQLAVGALSLCAGLWFYGYNMMRVLGNRLTFHSPSRGFSMELGAAITVLIAARNGIPVSVRH